MNKKFSFIVIFLVLMITTTAWWWIHVKEEHYDNSSEIVKQYFDALGVEGLRWQVVKQEEYNDRLSLVDVKVEGAFSAVLHFTLEKYRNRDEFRLVWIENMKEHKWRHQLNKKSFCVRHHPAT